MAESTGASGRYPKQWNLPSWKRILARPDVDYMEFRMCAFGLGPPEDKTAFYQHLTRVVYPAHLPLREALNRRCPGVSSQHRHVALKGARPGALVTRCTEAGVYCPEFVAVVCEVLRDTLDVITGGVKLAKNLRPRGQREVLRAGGFPEGNGPEDEDSQTDEEVRQAAAGEQDAGLGAEEGEVSEPTEVLAEEAVEEGEDPVTEDGDPMDAEEEETEDAEVADAAEVAGGVGTEDAEAADAAEVAGGVGTEDAEGADAAEVAGEVGEEAAEEEPKEEDELTEAATSGEGPGRAPSVVSEGSSKWWTPTDFYSNLPYQRDGIWAEEESVLAAEIPGHVDYFAVGDRREVVDAQQDKQEWGVKTPNKGPHWMDWMCGRCQEIELSSQFSTSWREGGCLCPQELASPFHRKSSETKGIPCASKLARGGRLLSKTTGVKEEKPTQHNFGFPRQRTTLGGTFPGRRR